ncbi:MAG TPA: flagellar basal body-associated FliL family protein [Actinotalea sp.]|nr:flagellar basal body-associated FliL family protein [Actinotalea sp.]
MATETRVVSDKKKIGAKGGSSGGGDDEQATTKGGKKKKVVIGAVVALAVAGGAYYFFLAPKADAEEKAEGTEEHAKVEHVELGDVLVADSVSINLAGGHYLRLGLALQLPAAGGHGKPDTARALDAAIELFSQQPLEVVNDPVKRAELKAELLHQLEETYHGDVIDVYFTDFVTQ